MDVTRIHLTSRSSEPVLCQLVARENWAGSSSVVLLPPSPPNYLGPDSIQMQDYGEQHGSALSEKPGRPRP